MLLCTNALGCKLSLEQRRAPVWYNGQAKTFQLAAHFTIKKLFKKVSLAQASNFYCTIMIGDKSEIIKNSIYRKSKNNYLELINKLPKIFNDANKIENEKKRDLALSRYEKIKIFQQVYRRKHIMYKNQTWMPIISIQNFSVKTFANALDVSSRQVESSTYLYENLIYEFKLLEFSFYFLIFAFLILFIPWRKKEVVSNIFIGVSFIAQISVVVLRVLYMQRAPIANMYETVLLSAPFALLLGVLFYRRNIYLYKFSALYALGAIGTLYFSGHMLDSEIKNLMPVLRDNFWLSTHVTSIVFSYSVLGITWMCANFGMISILLNKDFEKSKLDDAITIGLKYGSFFLFLGILLGAIWADYSWGRFWAWDPKETWSLIAFLVYMILFHALRGNLIPKPKVYIFVALAFMSILIAWFGVNFVLSSGLHSYGFSAGGSAFLGSLILLQIIIVFIYSYRLTGRTQ